MAYAMTKRGNLDNCVTYEFMCDTIQDMNDIEDKYRTIGSIAIVLEGYSGMEVYIAGSDKQWRALSAIGGGSGSSEGAESNLPIYTKTLEEATIEIENVNINNYANTINIDMTLLREGPATVEIGDHTFAVDFTYDENEDEISYYCYNSEAEFAMTLVQDYRQVLYMRHTINDLNGVQTIRIIYPAATQLYSIQDSLYLGADENGNNGVKVITTNKGRIAVGGGVTASGTATQAFGLDTTASGYASHAEGSVTVASGNPSHAEGYGTVASGDASHAEGLETKASGSTSHAEGAFTVAAGDEQHVSGRYNITDSIGKYAEIIGNGTADNARSNARALTWTGDERLKGDLYVRCNADSTGGTKVIPLPTPPSADGTYTLQCTVSNGTATYSWV